MFLLRTCRVFKMTKQVKQTPSEMNASHIAKTRIIMRTPKKSRKKNLRRRT